MKPEFKSEVKSSEVLFRLRLDCVPVGECDPFEVTTELLLDWFSTQGVIGYLITAEVSSAVEKAHLHVVFLSDKKVTALRTSFRKEFSVNYSFSQNWSKETKSRDMKIYMDKHALTYQDIHIIYILKDGNIQANTLISNNKELKFDEILKETKCGKKDKRYGNYLKKLLVDYNTKYQNEHLDNDEKEKIRIYKFVTQSFAQTNLDIFTGNAKIFDTYTIKRFCQTIYNTNFYIENQHSEEYMLYHFQTITL